MNDNGDLKVETLLTAKEIAGLLQVHIKTVYTLAKNGALPGHHVGRSWRFNWSEVLNAVTREGNMK